MNQLSPDDNGVFSAGVSNEFNYSDGDAAEQQLRSILRSADDLSSQSVELAEQIVDWPTEYHLSPTRANLLRGMNLDGVSRVLELGCGCGAISRYLGEQADIQVDAVEGSAIRAGLAAARCRDLENVSISTGNFNEMSFPESHYDLVLFVGVTEYAGRFSDRATDQEALQDLLALAKRACREGGRIVIAIENRTGLKYMLGANEDHYGVPYIGIDNYPQSSGIRTYSQTEWLEQIEQAGFAATRFAYPFPDYKVPSLLIREDTDNTKAELHSVLSRVRSRDYLAPFDLGEQEARLWQAATEAGVLGQLANSFLIVLGSDQQHVDALLDFSVVEYPHSDFSVQPREQAIQAEAAKQGAQTESARKLRQMTAELIALKEHAQHLQGKVDLMAQSRGWSFLNLVRRLFGRSSIK
ncbi:MAG: class I SAM-dependent methyltransferase [Pseudomonadota bacterium]